MTVTRASSATSSWSVTMPVESAAPPPTPNEKLLRRGFGEAAVFVAGKLTTTRARCER